jgi:hypothetical protein
MRRAAKVDANHARIRADLRALGFDVLDTFRLGDGAPDMVVAGFHREYGHQCAVLVEIKTETGTLTDDEKEYHATFANPGALIVARDAEDILFWFGWEFC